MLIMEQFLLASVLLLPSVLAAGLCAQMLQRWYASEWNPMDYLREWETRSPIKQTIVQLERLTLGRYDHSISFAIQRLSLIPI